MRGDLLESVRSNGDSGSWTRRHFVGALGALGVGPFTAWTRPDRDSRRRHDMLVIGAGVFGIWTALHLHRAGWRVAVIDAVGPAHSAASSGGESRVTRCGYGDADLYTEWACRSMAEWRALSDRAELPLFHDIGVLWLHRERDEFSEATARTLAAHDVPFARLSADELRSRYPVLRVDDDQRGILEPHAGGLMARRAVQRLAAELAADGVQFLHGRVRPISGSDARGGALASVTTVDGNEVEAEAFVFACGPWLDRVCPDVMSGRLFVTRQEVFYFGVDRARTGDLPVWADLPFYGLPSLEGRGFKVANDTHGPEVEDVSGLDRRASEEGEALAREFLALRFPALADSPLSESRVCQYENSSNGDFLLDRHPDLENVWLAGCGSGHGFKHGPAVGAHVAGLVNGAERTIPRFGLSTKATRREREIQ